MIGWALIAACASPEAPRAGALWKMEDHAGPAIQARDAVIIGDLAAVHAAGAALEARGPVPGLSREDRAAIAGVQMAGARLSRVGGRAEAAGAAAALAEACADCHVDRGVAVPIEASGAGHSQPARAMWAALLSGDGAGWRGGAAALAAATQPVDAEPRAWRDLVARVDVASQADTSATRAAGYASVSIACQACHAAEEPT